MGGWSLAGQDLTHVTPVGQTFPLFASPPKTKDPLLIPTAPPSYLGSAAAPGSAGFGWA